MRFARFAALPVLVAALCAAPGGCSTGTPDTDFAGAVERSRAVAEGLQSYDIEATMAVSSGMTGQPAAMTMDVALASAGRWPDGLANRQEGTGFVVDLGTGPDGAWLHIGQLGTCYVGGPAELTRDLEAAGEFQLTAESVYNFYSGIADFVLAAEPAPSDAEPVLETLAVDGREIPCVVYAFDAEVGEPTEGAVLRGESRVWFDPESGLVLKSERALHTLQNGVAVTQNLTTTVRRFALDGPVPDERFAFTPPEGVRVVDSLDKLTNPDSMAGQAAPPITFTALDGTETSLADYRGKVVFLNFWATWCPPCRIEMPHIQTLWEELGGSGEVVFLGASSEEKATITGFLEKNDYTFPIVRVDQQDVSGTYNTDSIPAIFVIDAEGVIRAHLVGAQSEAQMRAALAKAGVGG